MYAIIVAIDAITDTGSRCVTTNGRVGEHARASGPNCSRCWGDFSTQRVAAGRCHWQHLQHRLQVLVVRRLVVREVPLPPRRHHAHRLEEHRREVDGEELDLLVHVVDGHLVHALEERHRVRRGSRARRACGPAAGRRRPTRRRRARPSAAPARGSPSTGSERIAGSAAMRLCRWVVPVRGWPTMKIGRSIVLVEDLRVLGARGPRGAGGSSACRGPPRARLTRPMAERPGSWSSAPSSTPSGSRKPGAPKSSSPVSAAAAAVTGSARRARASATMASPRRASPGPRR